MKLPMAVKFVATLAQLGMAAWLGTSEHFYKSALLSIFFGVTLASVVLIHFRVRPSWQDVLLMLGWIAALRSALRVFWASPVVPWICCVVTVASAIFVRRRLEAAGDSRKRREAAGAPPVPVTVL